MTDAKGNVTNSDVVLFDLCSDTNPTPKLPDYVNNQRGELYKRLARISPNCRIEGVSDPSQAYKVIYTPETNLPPFISNTKGEGVGLLQPIDGNTLPIKRLQAGQNITIKDCGGSVIISGTGGTSGDCTCSTDYVGCEPILICGNTIRLDYNPCHFYTSCGRLTLTCQITSKLDKGATCYSFQKPLNLSSANTVQLCYDDADFISCNDKLHLKNAPLKGVVSSTGEKFNFYELESKSVPMFYFYVECTEIGIGASVKDGYLRLFGMNS